MAAFAAIVGVLLVLPGEVQSGFIHVCSLHGGSMSGSYYSYIHGWPWVFLTRTTDDEPPVAEFFADVPIPWLNPSSWMLTRADSFEFQPRALAGNALILSAAVVMVAAACEFRRRRRGSVWQTRLAELLGLMAVISGTLAWWKVQHSEVVRQEHSRLAIEQAGHHVYGWNHGPRWVERLTGLDLGLLPGIHEVEICATRDGLSGILPHLESIETLRAIRIIDREEGAGRDFPWSQLQALRHVRSVNLTYTSADDAVVPHLARLTHLEFIDLTGTEVSAAAVAALRRLTPRCEIVVREPSDPFGSVY